MQLWLYYLLRPFIQLFIGKKQKSNEEILASILPALKLPHGTAGFLLGVTVFGSGYLFFGPDDLILYDKKSGQMNRYRYADIADIRYAGIFATHLKVTLKNGRQFTLYVVDTLRFYDKDADPLSRDTTDKIVQEVLGNFKKFEQDHAYVKNATPASYTLPMSTSTPLPLCVEQFESHGIRRSGHGAGWYRFLSVLAAFIIVIAFVVILFFVVSIFIKD